MGKWVVYLILAIVPIIILITKADRWPFTDSKTLPDGYLRIPPDMAKIHKLVLKVVPNRPLRYWQYEEWMINRLTVVRSAGDTTLRKNVNSVDAEGGFFSNCVPIPVCHSVLSFIADKKVEYITSESEMIKFIGDVDNLEEAILIAMLKGYSVDEGDVRGGSYRRTDNSFTLYLCTGVDCPVTRRSVKVTITFNGKFTDENKEVYYQTDDCYIY